MKPLQRYSWSDIFWVLNFSRKIFFAIFGISFAASLGTCLFLYGAMRHTRELEFQAHYRHRIELLASTYQQLSSAFDSVARSAAQVLYERDRASRGTLTEAEIVKLRGELGVSNIYFFNKKGDWVRSTDGPVKGNLFSFCPDYRRLITGESKLEQTPLVPDNHASEDAIYKYTMIPSHDRSKVIDVSVHFDHFTKIMQEQVDADADLERIEFLAPSGVSLGQVVKKGLLKDPELQQHPVRGNMEVWQSSQLLVAHELKADSTNCCECRVKNLVAPGQAFRYQLVASVAYHSLRAGLEELKWKFAIILLIMTALSAAASIWLKKLLLGKLRSIHKTVEEITATKAFDRQIPLSSRAMRSADELDVLARQFNTMVETVRISQEAVIEVQKTEAKAIVAAQVAHDIRSPLTSMGISLSQLQTFINRSNQDHSIGESLATLKSGIDRVTGIVKKLSATYGRKQEVDADAVELPRLTLLDKVLLDVATEHQIKLARPECFSITGVSQTPTVWGVVQVTEIQSALSNLLNNAFEAISNNGHVTLDLKIIGMSIVVKVIDDGVGIPQVNLEHVFERKFTFGKETGTGLGLFQAKTAVEWNGGKLTVESLVGKGTTFTLVLPIERKPAWCAVELELRAGSPLVFVDDDPSILSLWKQKTKQLTTVPVHFFQSIPEFQRAFPPAVWPAQGVLVIDQHLNSQPALQTGLWLLGEMGLGKSGYLCTSEFDDITIQDKVKALGVRLVPKPCIAAFEFKVEELGAI